MKMQWSEEHLQKEQIMYLIEIWNNIISINLLVHASFVDTSACVACPLKLATQEPVLVIYEIWKKLF